MASAIVEQVWSLQKQVGAQAVAAMYPNDFEWYMVALELTDSQDNTIDYIAFPITPDSITKTEPTRTNVKKSLSGITVLTNPSFTPQEINIKGSFGRNFKILLNVSNPVTTTGVAFSTVSGKYDLYSIKKGASLLTLRTSQFNVGVKTGYGVTKIIKAMLSKSVGLGQDGKPLRLYFYNMALGESYLVVVPPSGARFSQDLSKNMIWNYNITMIAIAPLELVANKKNAKSWLINSLANAAIQTGVNDLATKVTRAIL